MFISYSRSDKAYVERLATHLADAGVPVWFDHAMVPGDQWEEVIIEKINTCAAVLIVMTPESKASKWVKREISHAEGQDKRLIPLLLAGKVFFRLSDYHYADVRDGRLPNERLIDELLALAGSTAAGPAEAPPSQSPANIAAATIGWSTVQIGFAGRGIRQQVPPLSEAHQLIFDPAILDGLFPQATSASYPPALAEDVLLVAGGDRRLYGVDGHTGAVRWSVAGRDGILSTPLAVQGRRVLVYDSTTHLHCIDTNSGELLWSRLLTYPASQIRLHTTPSTVYVAVGNQPTPTQQPAVSSNPTVATVQTGVAIIGAFRGRPEGRIIAFDLAIGVERWQGSTNLGQPLFALDDHVVVCRGRRVVSLSAEAGKVRWECAVDQEPTALFADVDNVICGTVSGRVANIDPASGTRRWQVIPRPRPSVRFLPGDPITWRLGVADGVVIAARPEGKRVYGLDATTGESGWHVHVSGWGGQLSAVAVADGVAYVGSRDMHAIEVATGRVRWVYRPDGRASAAAVDGSNVYFGTDRSIYAVAASTGEPHWRHPVGRWLGTAPTVANGHVYVIDGDATVTALMA
ncbi:outer membrane protein assembly factor BamB [Asanoa ferruginea]|uniref:Outer membrane protein assembly factor BamB n=1 Tax=Asanoa ferruginea TaxID=53367 RepID=A0A3D9ZKQ1_9ACTN|nr:outer membrane protein assembly factor BamB [Asanoa ferruginea]